MKAVGSGWGGLALLAVLACAGTPPPARAELVTEIAPAAVANRPPRFQSRAPLRAWEGRPYSYEFCALDPDGDAMRFELVAAPAGATLVGHLLTWRPRPDQTGRPQTFTLKAVDEFGAAQVQSWSVVPRPEPVPAGSRRGSRSEAKSDRSSENEGGRK